VCALAFSGQSIKNTYLPIDVTTHLGGTLGIYGTIAAVTPIMELVAMPLAGMLAMRMPIGRLIVAGLITGAVEYLCLSGNSALWQLYITQVLDAWVVAVIMGLGVTYGQQLSPDRPGEVSGIIFGGTSVSAVLGNLVGGVTVPALGIPHVFLIPTGFFAVSCMMFLGIERMSRRKAVAAIVVDERRAAG
jgi:SET family sugar efflux transporter-like MFS transporter